MLRRFMSIRSWLTNRRETPDASPIQPITGADDEQIFKLGAAVTAPEVPGRRRRLIRRSAAAAACGAWLLGCSVLGSVLALHAFSGDDYRLGAARVRVETQLSGRGTVDAYVPLVDWGVRAHPFPAPIELRATLVSIDRTAVAGSLSTPGGARARLDSVTADAPRVARSALRRAAVVALIGGAAGGFLGGLALAAAGRRRAMIAIGAGTGLGVAGASILVCAALLRSPDFSAFRTPTFYAHGGELPRLLAVSARFASASAAYASSYQQAVAGLDTLIGAAAGTPPPAGGTRSVFVGSDIHSNWLTLPTFSRFADRRPVFLVGDYTQQGTPVEAAIAERVAAVGDPLVVVSGNHDTPLVMRTFAQAGALVLTHRGTLDANGRIRGPVVVSVAGLLVAGYEDPLERRAGVFGHRLDFTDTELAAYEERVDEWFDTLQPRPQIVLVHDFRVAAALRAHAAASSSEPLLILTGHDHRQHVDRTSNIVVVDGGTLGAGGVFGVGTQPAGFARVSLDGTGWPTAVDLIGADPISGDATARHVVLEQRAGTSSLPTPQLLKLNHDFPSRP